MTAERHGVTAYRGADDAMAWNVSLWSNESFSVGRLGFTDGEYRYTGSTRPDQFVIGPQSGTFRPSARATWNTNAGSRLTAPPATCSA
jgi:hypothetical protein